MKHTLSVILSVVLAFCALFSLSSCDDAKPNVEEATVDTAVITVPTEKETKPKETVSVVREIKRVKPDNIEIDSKIQSLLEKKLKENNFSGVAIISKKGKIVAEAAYGKLSSKSKKDINIGTPFAIASCSKQFTAAAIMILKDEGKLKVSDTLDKYFPKYKYGKKITIKNLLTMRSGIPDFLNETSNFSKYDLSKNASEKKNRKVTMDWIKSHGLKFNVDGLYDYCNSNYFLLAEIVEKVSKMSFSEFLQEKIFKPLGMESTGVNEELAYCKELAVSDRDPYDLPGAKGKNIPLTIRVKGLNFGNGGLVSTAEDMDKWLTSLREHTIISEKSVKEMTTDYNKDSEHYGYGLKITNDGACWHVGALDYYGSISYTIPKKEYNFFAVTNDKKSMNSDIYTFSFGIINSTK